MANYLTRTQALSRKIATMRARIESGQVFRLRDIKEIRSESEQLIIDWRTLRGDIPDTTFFSVMEVLIDSLNQINSVYLDSITRGRGRVSRDFVLLREPTEERDYGVPAREASLQPNLVTYDADRGSRRDNYQYRRSYRHIVSFGDTLQSIAKERTGSEDNWRFIAQVNGISRSSELQTGDEIIIPEINAFGGDASDAPDFIISEVASTSEGSGQDLVLGTDILVDPERGVLLDEDGNSLTVSGVNNVRQALNHRLQTQLGSLIQHSDTYGLTSVVGIPGVELSNKYLRMSVVNTLIKDPRVARVARIEVDRDADIFRIAVTVELIRNAGEVTAEASIAR